MRSKIAMPYFVGVPVTAPPASAPLCLCSVSYVCSVAFVRV